MSSSPGAAESTRTVIERFNEAFNNHDVNALAQLLTDDTVFENTSPPPDGTRIANPRGSRSLKSRCAVRSEYWTISAADSRTISGSRSIKQNSKRRIFVTIY